MKILTKEIEKKLAGYGDLSDKTMEEITVPWKLFDCMGNWTWFIYEYDKQTGLAMALVSGFEIELGSVSIPELQKALGWRLERDKWFRDTNLKELYLGLLDGKYF